MTFAFKTILFLKMHLIYIYIYFLWFSLKSHYKISVRTKHTLHNWLLCITKSQYKKLCVFKKYFIACDLKKHKLLKVVISRFVIWLKIALWNLSTKHTSHVIVCFASHYSFGFFGSICLIKFIYPNKKQNIYLNYI